MPRTKRTKIYKRFNMVYERLKKAGLCHDHIMAALRACDKFLNESFLYGSTGMARAAENALKLISEEKQAKDKGWSDMKISVSTDGGETWEDVNNARVLYQVLLPPRKDEDPLRDPEMGTLCVNCTPEGLIMDVWQDDYPLDNCGTSSQMAQDIADDLVEEYRFRKGVTEGERKTP